MIDAYKEARELTTKRAAVEALAKIGGGEAILFLEMISKEQSIEGETLHGYSMEFIASRALESIKTRA